MADVIRLLFNKYRARGFLWMLNNLNAWCFVVNITVFMVKHDDV